MASSRLGKGLDELFGTNVDDILDAISEGDSKKKTEIPLSEIRANPYQPRKSFDQDKLKELASSIKEHGVFQPILVRKSQVSGYELVAGERRLRASKLAGKETIPAIVVEFDETEMMEISLLENIQREDLSPMEEAEAYKQLIDKIGYTQDELARRLGKSRSNITNSLRLLKLPLEIQNYVREGKLSYGQARTILSLEEEKAQLALAEKAVKEGLTVRSLERLVNQKPIVKKEKTKKDRYLEEVRLRLERKFATSVEVKKKSLTIHFNNTADLNRILDILHALEETYQD